MTAPTIERLWYADPLSCLYSTFGTVMLNSGMDPGDLLGRTFRFAWDPHDTPSEEFYRPAVSDDGVLDDLAPGLGMSSVWRRADGVGDLVGAQREHGVVVVAVDNYHLPFRPAYHDVHAAHLVVVSGVRTGPAGTEVYVTDAQPPAFSGWLPARHLEDAAFSANPSDEQDRFFSAAPIAGRYLTFRFGDGRPRPGGPGPDLAGTVAANLADWHTGPAGTTGPDTDTTGVRRGRAGLRELAEHVHAADPAGLSFLYTLGWSFQAESYLHAEHLRERARTAHDRELSDVARAVRDVSLAWTDLRLAATAPGEGPGDPVRSAAAGVEALLAAYDRATERMRTWLTTTGADR